MKNYLQSTQICHTRSHPELFSPLHIFTAHFKLYAYFSIISSFICRDPKLHFLVFHYFIVCFLCNHFINIRWWVKYDAYFWLDITIHLHMMKCNFISLLKNYSSYKKYLPDLQFLTFFFNTIFNHLKYMDSITQFIHPLCQVTGTGTSIKYVVSIHLVKPTTCTSKYIYI